jgi:hypothetical protein
MKGLPIQAVVPCPNQYAGLAHAQGLSVPCARQIPVHEVEVRSLYVYERLAGVSL